ncbi:MFS transporter [Coxiella burnetii]|uniref:MFS transporter n=1 Tax=Coxiella burnetii TaxID=777 RepID=UPI00222FEBD8|nr:MFS transporter [Coxiella burnetii]
MGYLLSAFAVGIHSLTFLILGRVIAGFTAGSQPIAQAAIVDVSSEAHKARNIGLILLAISLGFIIGPIIGGVLSDSQFVSWFGFSTPLYFASLISLINAFLLGWLFNETFQRTKKINIKLQHAVDIFMSAFKHKKVRKLSIVLLVMIYGWSNFFSFIAMFVLHRYGFAPLKISLLLADMGIGFSIGCAYLVDRFVKYFNLKSIITISFFLTAIFILLIIVTHQAVYLWGLMIAVGTAIAVGYSAIITCFQIR